MDICWSPDGQRICAVGDGKQEFVIFSQCVLNIFLSRAKVFAWDSGNTAGKIEGY